MVADRGGGRPTGQGTRPQTPKQASKQESGSVRADVPFAIPLDFEEHRGNSVWRIELKLVQVSRMLYVSVT